MEELTIFDILYPTYKITKPIRLITLFSGYDSQALALKYLGVPFEHYKTCEWNIKSTQAIKDLHFENEDVSLNENRTKEEMVDFLYRKGISSNWNEPMTREQISKLSEKELKTIIKNIAITHNLVNIQQVKGKDLELKDTDKFTYLLTYSFPCQDLSVAGKRQLMSDTSTRSGMLWEVERILFECKELGTLPEVLLMENVPQVHGEGALQDFIKWQNRLEELGYKNYWQDLIATDYGIPQTRNRTFMVSILGDYNYTFPKPIPLKLKLKDMLEDNVDEKYFLSDKMIDFYIFNSEDNKNKGNGFRFEPVEKEKAKISKTITTRAGSRMDDNFITNKPLRETLEKYDNEIVKTNQFIDAYNRTIRDDDLVSTISTRIDASNNNYLLIKNANSKGYLEATEGDEIDISSRMEYQRGTVQKNKTQTITCMGGENNGVIDKDLKIRKLTPKECFRLMGVRDEDFEKIAKNQSDSSLYHLAGDSIVVNVLMAIFKGML